ncbi:hypothetical protein K431DRAFT_289281 [Polychaeton citri CBS 116435]|uniref:Uncharacterized protein n=1 Tax=Polychaeton citri CBS 116435 TaxID=1314669 RepID=A0A9P4UL50_9PEZI|nr:hypothetical protein K431DRAFT_289281 [Polychaeton citri CBS 116435]
MAYSGGAHIPRDDNNISDDFDYLKIVKIVAGVILGISSLGSALYIWLRKRRQQEQKDQPSGYTRVWDTENSFNMSRHEALDAMPLTSDDPYARATELEGPHSKSPAINSHAIAVELPDTTPIPAQKAHTRSS